VAEVHRRSHEGVQAMRIARNTAMFPVIALVILAGLGLTGCLTRVDFAPPQNLPLEYYASTEVDPQALVNTYYVGNVDITSVRAKYDGVAFVFKDVMVSDRTFLQLDEGFIWVDQVRCYLVNPNTMKKFKPGDKIDVVGRNDGQTSLFTPGLTFMGCYALTAGEIGLPADPNAAPGTFGPLY
jgi:hypothetical protein